jgi:hypothetical protein
MNVLRFEYEIHACGLRAHQFPEATLAELFQIKTKLVQTPAETNFLADSGFYFGP